MFEIFDSTVLTLHILAGFMSIVMFWVPALSRKGSSLHVRSGRIYVWGMWTVVISAGILCINNIFTDEYLSAGFLGFISILTLAPLWYGTRIIRHKKQVNRRYFLTRRILNTSILISAVALLTWGALLRFEGMSILLLIFGVIGLTAVQDVFMTLEKLQARPWIVEHLNGMLGTSIAAHTAFLVFGGQSLLGNIFQGQMVVLLWIAPSIIGSIAIAWQSRKYRVVVKK